MSEILHTKFGNARMNDEGYYLITSRVENNHGKLLHRLIYESFWDIQLPPQIHIHHKDGNKSNNCILNLEAIPINEHLQSHAIGRYHSNKTKLKLSKQRNTTGYFRVCKEYNSSFTQGFRWRYFYMENGKQRNISSVSLEKLKQKVIDKGLKWEDMDDN